MSGLSSRVLNMKFMRASDPGKKSGSTDDQQSKVKDSSEWALRDSKTIIANNSPKLIQSVGYGDIHRFDDDEDSDADEENDVVVPKTVKRSWGNDKPESQDAIEFSSIKASTKSTQTKSKVCTYAKEVTENDTNKKQKSKNTSSPPKEETVALPDNVTDLNSNDFLNSVFQPKKRSNEDTTEKSKKLKKRKRLDK